MGPRGAKRIDSFEASGGVGRRKGLTKAARGARSRVLSANELEGVWRRIRVASDGVRSGAWEKDGAGWVSYARP
jgi:hypothetical protein